MSEVLKGIDYRDAGVDRDAGNRAKHRIGELVRSTLGPLVISEPGSFGGIMRLPEGLAKPALVASADGVGTKLKVAMMTGRHDTVGRDLVNHCVNDILVEGARPLFFLDYIGMGRLEEGVVEALVGGVAEGCRDAGCALLGGETAEMPDFYAPGEYDLAGFIVGVVEEEQRPGAARVQEGDALIGLPANGFHTNGYSLLRKAIFERAGLTPQDEMPGTGASVADVLLRVHRSYLDPVHGLIRSGRVHALAHITGGGLPENLDRVLPPSLDAAVDRSSWTVPAEFRSVQELGGVDEEEMFRTFNMGVGMVVITGSDAADRLVQDLLESGVEAWRMGSVLPGSGKVVLQ